MSPLSLIPSWAWASAVAAMTVALALCGMQIASLKLDVQKGKTHVAQLEGSIATANKEAADKAAAYERTAKDALAAAKTRERALSADANAARNELQRLSHAASTYSLSRRASPLAPSLDVTDIFQELFLDCSRRYIYVAAEADQWKSDAIMLHEAWPAP